MVSGDDGATLEKVSALYELIIEAGVHKVSSIKVAVSRIGIKAPGVIGVMAPLRGCRKWRFERVGEWAKTARNASTKFA